MLEYSNFLRLTSFNFTLFLQEAAICSEPDVCRHAWYDHVVIRRSHFSHVSKAELPSLSYVHTAPRAPGLTHRLFCGCDSIWKKG